jgi:hypothetical protein
VRLLSHLGIHFHVSNLLFARYLEEDPSTTVLERRSDLVGYEVYIVEQWACSRVDPTFVITTFTGLPHHTVSVGVLSIPTNEDEWSPRLRVYLKAISKFYARRKETPLGILMVTNLSSFPSALNVIAVPGGDVKSHREDFIVNEDLKRLGCSGRAGMNLAPPVPATQTKFLQQYHTSDVIPLRSAVIELVKLCQVALVMFTKLAPEYADGLLCDVTERAINDWWTDVGIDYFNLEPSDGILGPTTVAALLGMFLGSKNRLNAFGAPVGKDAFDLKAMKRGVAYFQKAQKIPKTRRLDRQTLHRLHRATSKAAKSEGWAVPRAVKSTVAELSGKSGEMVMEMVGGRDKTGIAEVETSDLGSFVQAISGERCKWLWQGKPRKSHTGDHLYALTGDDEMVFSGDETGGYMWSSRKRDSMAEQGSNGLDHLYLQPSQGSQNSFETSEKDQAFRKTVLKSVTGKMSDARSGLGRFKDAVGISGLRGHLHKESREENLLPNYHTSKKHGTRDSQGRINFVTAEASPKSDIGPMLDAQLYEETRKNKADDAGLSEQNTVAVIGNLSSHDPTKSRENSVVTTMDALTGGLKADSKDNDSPVFKFDEETTMKSNSNEPLSGMPINSSEVLEGSKHGYDGVAKWAALNISPAMQSTGSVDQFFSSSNLGHPTSRLPRQLSFSLVDDMLLNKREVEPRSEAVTQGATPVNVMVNEHYLSVKTGQMTARVEQLESQEKIWVSHKVHLVEEYSQTASSDVDTLNAVSHAKLNEYNELRVAIATALTEEKSSLTEALKEIDLLGARLEYELSALQSKVEDVEDGVVEYSRYVEELEIRVQELDDGRIGEEKWSNWLYKICMRRDL